MIELIKSYILVRMANDKDHTGEWDWYAYDSEDEDDQTCQLLHDWLCENQRNISNWPEVDGTEEDEEPEMEDVDLENVEIIQITDDLIELDAGGDWQNPTRMIIKIVDDQLTCTSAILCKDFGDGELSEKQIEEILKIEQ